MAVCIRLDPAVVQALGSGAARVRYTAVVGRNREVVEESIETIGIAQLPAVLHDHATALRLAPPDR